MPTNILPETAVTTEIYFGKEKIEAYKFGDDKPQEIINSLDLSKFDSSKYDFLKIYTSSEAIKNLPLTLVDMPGFDSNIERHNKSIFKYMEQSLSFILVIDVDDGTIKSNTINFLREIRDNRLDFFVIINKSDKKLASEVKAVQSGIKNLLINQQLLTNPFVGTVSAFDDEIDDFKKSYFVN